MNGVLVRTRCVVVAIATLVAGSVLVLGCGWVAASTSPDTVEGAVVLLCGGVGAAAVLVLAVQMLCGVADAWRGRITQHASAARRWVRATCGVGLGVALALPASGAWATPTPPAPSHGQSTLSGLPLPEQPSDAEPRSPEVSLEARPLTPSRGRTTEPTGPEPTTAAVHVVRPGDTLWDLAHSELAATRASVGNVAIAARWQDWYARNRAAIGPDPDLLQPGTRLVRPAPASPSVTEN